MKFVWQQLKAEKIKLNHSNEKCTKNMLEHHLNTQPNWWNRNSMIIPNHVHCLQMLYINPTNAFIVCCCCRFFCILIAFLSFLFLYSFRSFFVSPKKERRKKKKNLIRRMKRNEVNEVCMCCNLNDYMRQHGLRKFK